MPTYHRAELELFEEITCDPRCFEQELTCYLRKPFGVLIARRGRPIGSWEAKGDRLIYRSLSCEKINLATDTVQDAVLASLVVTGLQ